MFGTCFAGQVTWHQLVPVRGHHQFHSDGHLVVCLPPFHPGGYQFPYQLGAHGIIIISLYTCDNKYYVTAKDKQKHTQIYSFQTMYLKVPIKVKGHLIIECKLGQIVLAAKGQKGRL